MILATGIEHVMIDTNHWPSNVIVTFPVTPLSTKKHGDLSLTKEYTEFISKF